MSVRVRVLRVHAALQDLHAPRACRVDGLHHAHGFLFVSVSVLVRVPFDGHLLERPRDVVDGGGGFVEAQGLERVRGLGGGIGRLVVVDTLVSVDTLGPVGIVPEPGVRILAPSSVVRLRGGKQLREGRDEDDDDDAEDVDHPVPQLHHRVGLGVPNPAGAPGTSPLFLRELFVQRHDLLLAHAGAVELAGSGVEAAGHGTVGAAGGLLATALPRLDAHGGVKPWRPLAPHAE